MALGIGLLAWPSQARSGEVATNDFTDVLPAAAAFDAQTDLEQTNWFPSLSDAVVDPVPHAQAKPAKTPAASRDTEFTAPTAPLPPAVFAGLVGISVVAWSVHRVKKRGWV
jgi:hypothetical protein